MAKQLPPLTSLNDDDMNESLLENEISSELFRHLQQTSSDQPTITRNFSIISPKTSPKNQKVEPITSDSNLTNNQDYSSNTLSKIRIGEEVPISTLPLFAKSLAPKQNFLDIIMIPINFIRSKFSAGSIKGSILTLISTTIGGGVLGFPKSFEAAGLGFGAFLTILAGFIAYYSTRLLVKSSMKSGLYSYSRIALHTYGKKAEIVVKLTLFLFFWGVCVYYNILFNNEILALIQQFFPNCPKYMTYWCFWPPIYTTIFILPMNLPRQLTTLRYFCLVKFGVILFITFVVFYEMFDPNISDLHKGGNAKIINIPGISSSFPNILFSFMCHANVLDVFKELKGATERRMSKVLRRAISSTAIIYLAVGITGFLTFSQLANYNNLVNSDPFPSSILTGPYNGAQLVTIASFLVGITLLVAGALNGKPAKDSLRDFFFPFDIKDKSSPLNFDPPRRHLTLVMINVYSQMLLAMFFKNIILFIDFLGSTAAPFIFFIFPSFFYLKLDNSPRWALNRVVCWILNILMMIFAIYSTIEAIINLIEALEQLNQMNIRSTNQTQFVISLIFKYVLIAEPLLGDRFTSIAPFFQFKMLFQITFGLYVGYCMS